MFLNFKRNNSDSKQTEELNLNKIPKHIAIIMDGNGRWAQQKHLPRIAGHREGMQTVKKITVAASDLGVKVLSLYAFSTENWKRPKEEVNYLMSLPGKFFETFVPDLIKNNVRVMVMGNISKLPEATQKAVNDAIEQTANCNGMVLNFALNYGGRIEIVEATKQAAQAVLDNKLTVEQIDEEELSSLMMTSPLGDFEDPELLIRTSGEQRISNFMLWQLAYSELVFVDEHWPDFTHESLERAIQIYQGRHRRFGGLEKNK